MHNSDSYTIFRCLIHIPNEHKLIHGFADPNFMCFHRTWRKVLPKHLTLSIRARLWKRVRKDPKLPYFNGNARDPSGSRGQECTQAGSKAVLCRALAHSRGRCTMPDSVSLERPAAPRWAGSRSAQPGPAGRQRGGVPGAPRALRPRPRRAEAAPRSHAASAVRPRAARTTAEHGASPAPSRGRPGAPRGEGRLLTGTARRRPGNSVSWSSSRSASIPPASPSGRSAWCRPASRRPVRGGGAARLPLALGACQTTAGREAEKGGSAGSPRRPLLPARPAEPPSRAAPGAAPGRRAAPTGPSPHRRAARRGTEKPLPAPAPERPAEQARRRRCRPPRGTPAALTRTDPAAELASVPAAAAAAAARPRCCCCYCCCSRSAPHLPAIHSRLHFLLLRAVPCAPLPPTSRGGTGTLPPRRSTAGPRPPPGLRSAAARGRARHRLKETAPLSGPGPAGARGRGPRMPAGILVSWGGTFYPVLTLPMGASESIWSVHLSQKKCSM